MITFDGHIYIYVCVCVHIYTIFRHVWYAGLILTQCRNIEVFWNAAKKSIILKKVLFIIRSYIWDDSCLVHVCVKQNEADTK